MKRINHFFAWLLSFLPDRAFTKLTFILKHRKFPNLKNPVLFNEKLLYLKLTDRDDLYKILVDKYMVREFIKNKIGDEYLIPLIGHYDNANEIPFEQLPDKFALKLTNGSQHNIICKDKNDIDWAKSKKIINKWLKYDFYKRTREWPYKDKKSKIVIEQYMVDSQGHLNDFKFWCFNGQPEFVEIDSERFYNHKRDFYNIEFNHKLPFYISHKHSESSFTKPINYEKMVEIVKILAKGLRYVRIDLYNIDGKIYFGEFTFYPGNCNEPIKPKLYEKTFGSLIQV